MNRPDPVPSHDGPPPYEYTSWPAWHWGPEGQRQIFNAPEEVPAGWARNRDEVDGDAAEDEREITTEQATLTAAKLEADNSAAQLVAMLEAMAEVDDAVEFSPNWPKKKLAETIVAHGGPLDNED